MIAPRWRKVLRDIAEAPLRTALAVLAMTAGAFGLGAILTSYAILTRELAATYNGTRPASAILVSYGVTDAVVDSTRRLPGVLDAEARPTIRCRVRVGKDEWRPMVLFVVRDFRDLHIDTFMPNAGIWPPSDDDVLLERSSLSVARAAIGDRVTVKSNEGGERRLRIAGTVHAAGLAPGWMDHVVSGFVTWHSVMRGDPQKEAARLMIVVAGNRLDEMHIREVADGVQTSLEKQGLRVVRIDVPPPGRHPHADQMETFLFLLGAFAALTLALSAVLVANLIHALLIEQVRQVGVMKTVGATTRQIAALYLGQVSILAAISLCIGMPLGFAAGRAYAQFAGVSILNATIASNAVPVWVIVIQIAVGLLVPLLVALGPVYRASRISIHQAFSNDVGARPFGLRRFDRWLARLRWPPRPLMLSLRTTFHRRGRLILTISTLAVGGAVFITTLNVSAAWTRALDQDARSRRYDFDVRLTDPYPIARLAAALATVPAVAHAEYWPDTSAVLIGVDRRRPRLTHGTDDERVNLIAPDIDSKLLALPLLQGRWLTADDRDAVVINQALLARVPALHLGSNVVLRVNGRNVSWRVVGVVKEMAPFPTAYAPARSLLEAMQQPSGTSRSIRIVIRRRDAASLLAVSREVERALERAGIGVSNVQVLADLRKAFEDHLVIIDTALILAAALVVLVGALGLTSTMTLNVIERTREIGILSAIGATPGTIAGHIVLEGVLIGTLSWCAAVAAAAPITFLLDQVSGQIFIKSSLTFVMSPRAAAIWLALVVILASLSSFYPAWRSARLAVREALAYE